MSAPDVRTPGGNRANAGKETENKRSVSPAAACRNDGASTREKLLATICAALALRGHQVHTLASGEFLVCRWGLSRVCPSIETLRTFARQIGALQ